MKPIKHYWNIFLEKADYTSTLVDFTKKKIHFYYDTEYEISEINSLIREAIVKITCAEQGILWLHASAFSINNKTFLIIGQKGYGKTTLLLNSILNLKSNFLCNDQIPLFIENNKVKTFCWRPDLKITLDIAKKINLVSNSINNAEKVFFLINNKLPYSFINFDKMSNRLGKIFIPPENDLKLNYEKKDCTIDYIFILSPEQTISEIEVPDILKYANTDPETITVPKLNNMGKTMPYWNKRIKPVTINSEAYILNNTIINQLNLQCKMFSVGNRLPFSQISEFIKLLLN